MEQLNNSAALEVGTTADVQAIKEGGGIKPIDLTGDFKEVFSPQQRQK
jgi:hypothetical protein